jgi:hypothetical protein
VATTSTDAVTQSVSDIADYYANKDFKENKSPQDIADEATKKSESENEAKVKIKTKDLLYGATGDAPQLLAKGKLYEGIVGDEVAMGTNLTDALNKGGGGGIGGKIDININLTGSIGGDPGQITKMFNSPQVQKQIMDTVLYKMNEYKKQQGVLS